MITKSSELNDQEWRNSAIPLILWLSILIQMMDHPALASELNPESWDRTPWPYFVGFLILLGFVTKILFRVNFGRTKRKTDLKRPFRAQKGRPVYSVYYREPSSKSIQFRGKIIERRLKERGNNFKDLSAKVRRDYSYRVIDPNGIFILASNPKKE